ncbi:lysylphosphatidylglycerol synthase transmembrane domain-containing protein [Ilumatobacter nonamiensis]|uniref:lysylphosphatidylglycerol synthase transmembrane domain-containing protein n=1 Tax=Ilumatobacter nonamiensis TaxID=467093 RepID=UPI0003460406|nr:lysylphosphatidylglycerol synthase transmembrane domain-containing protein [Ilumatobacter nonamiensis]
MSGTVTDPGAPGAHPVVLFPPPPSRQKWSSVDLLRLLLGVVLGAAGLFAATFADSTISGVESDVIDAVGRIPDSVEQAVVGSAQIIATFVPVFAVVVVVWRRRWRLLFMLLLAATVASATIGLLTGWLGDRDVVAVLAERAATSADLVAADFPTTEYVATAVAATVVGAASLPRRWKRAAWSWVVVLMVLRFLGPGQPPLDVWIAGSIGVVIGSLTLLVFGSPNLEPSPEQVLAALRGAGLDPIEIRRRDDITGGSTAYETVDRDESQRFVKMRTPDDRSWDLLNRLFRTIRLRSSEVSRPYSTLKRRVEHESLALRTVRDGGTRSPLVTCVGVTSSGAAFLVEELVSGRLLSNLAPDEFNDDIARSAFRAVRSVHSTRIAHHSLTLDNMIVDDADHVWLLDFDEAELAADQRARSRDVAEILVALGLAIGPERSVRLGVDELGSDAVARAIPLVQPLALSRSLGKSIRSERNLLDQLRHEMHELTGADDVPLERLARVQTRTLLMILAGALAFYSLLPQFGNLGDTVDAFGDARWPWIPALLAASLAYFVFATISFLGSVAQPMPVAASARSQIASSFAQLVGPASAGKMALAGRFLQRNGLTPAEASASVALNAIAGISTHLLLMAGFFAWAGGADVGGISLPSFGTLLLAAGVAVLAIGIAFLFRRVRRLVIRPVIDGLRTAAGYVAQISRSPIRVVGLLGGSAMITMSYLFALVFSVEAFGGGLTVAQIGAAYLGAAAIANIAPTPGGIGPLEAAMIAALTGFGLDAPVAISSVLTFRLATFWLPIAPGWATFLWMERRGEI